MRAPPQPVLAMHTAPAFLAALADAAGPQTQVRVVEGWEALERTLARMPPTVVVFLDPYQGEGEGGAPSRRLAALLASLRTASVVAAFPVTLETAGHLDLLASWGVAEVVDVGREDTPAGLRRRLRQVRGRLVSRLLERALPRAVPTRARTLLAAAAGVAATGGGSGDLAAVLGATERTVLRWCRRADLPHPRRLLAWLRVLLAADMLDDAGRSQEQVAHACGYSGGAALRNAVRGLLGAPPGTLRGRAFATAAEAFGRELSGLRDAAHARGRPEKTWLH